MNTTANTTVETNSKEVTTTAINTGNGKYSKIAESFAYKATRLFDFSVEQAQRFADSLMSDMGRLNLTAETLKVSKANKDGMVKLTSTESTGKGRVMETPALTLVAGIVELEKAMERIPSLGMSGHFTLPNYLQFNAKKTS